ncbi:unnamed protein product [Brachionus calyciflorus]|uniref:Uncharacterized protein n=1 Tax=Brachionus calyciflorus TaxID=104777 RepID=A0A814LBD4_9BILA|nr:unnamed protein product [Brachionus calyciflorus]
MNYYPHVVAVIAITLLLYVVRKKGRPAYNSIRLFTVWFEIQDIAANQSIFDKHSVLIPPDYSIDQSEPQVQKPTIKKSRKQRAPLKILETIEESG